MKQAVPCDRRPAGWAVPALAALFLLAGPPLATQGGAELAAVEMAKPAGLVDQAGRAVTTQDFLGKPSLLVFGFTSCPSICPTTLNDIAARMADLGALAARINVIFVSVDPERDTPDILRDYLGSFDRRIIGLTGREDAIGTLAKAVGAQFQKVPQDGGGYTVDHSVQAFLMDRDWRRTGILILGHGTDARRANARLRAMLVEAEH